ncbi:hypothetical protein O0L34_g8879 [Tuta absoluta]|nr:hypothetical protein O0L34_g8879 [Tuta absoluta]
MSSVRSSQHLEQLIPKRRTLPKLIACITKQSLDNMRNKALFTIDTLDTKGIRRRKRPLWECLILELKEAGFVESSNYLQDLLYDNAQLVEQDEIGIVVNLKDRNDYLENICARLQDGEREKDRGDTMKECKVFLKLGLDYAEKGKGILWLAEKFFLVAIAVASRYMLDGGRLKGLCKYYYSKFLLDKFPGADTEEPYLILTEVRDASIGKDWPLHETKKDGPKELLFDATSRQLQRVLLQRSRLIRRCDAAKAERLARLAERRGMDAKDPPLVAEAIIEVGICQLAMDNLNNAKKTFHRAFKLNTEINNIPGLCTTRMHLASVMQRLGDHEQAAQLLTEMGALAMEHDLRLELGLALHLLGELHLRRERPELGTQHLTEAFSCFMGSVFTCGDKSNPIFSLESGWSVGDTGMKKILSSLGTIYSTTKNEVYKEEAERSRLMTAISAGQEIMASYFRLLLAARTCTVATVQCIEWKLAQHGWWVQRPHHELIPCVCAVHNRTPLDVLWTQVAIMNAEQNVSTSDIKSVIKIAGEKMSPSFADLNQLKSESRVNIADKDTSKKAVTMEGDKKASYKIETEKKEDKK